MKTANYNIRINPEIKQKAEKTFAAFGMNLSEAINIFLYKALQVNGLPFDVRREFPQEIYDELETISQNRQDDDYVSADIFLKEIDNVISEVEHAKI